MCTPPTSSDVMMMHQRARGAAVGGHAPSSLPAGPLLATIALRPARIHVSSML